MTTRTETNAVRKALKAAGIVANVAAGRGTSRAWILVTVSRTICSAEDFVALTGRIASIARKATGRDDYNGGRISVGC